MIFRLTLTTLLIGLFGPAYGCKCARDLTVMESFGGSTFIVHGKVVAKRLTSFSETMDTEHANYVKTKLRDDDKSKLELFLSDFVYEVKLVVLENFKEGTVGDTLSVYTTKTHGSCGISFDLNKEYLVYTLKTCHQYFLFLTESEREKKFEKENTHWVHACTRTAEYNRSEAAELRELQTGIRK
jgi:hypothetical protein